ncbi:hypothetical protein [Bradyrhizobium sp. CCBAU 51627]|uniref:hypothetical protein n=1 Tax=Bradyrhizobium sp. CCBAU 51627 TaxID=1325088 RepID=UPI002305732D|nr:hypothetical protein [Bradyrhizobium sp. CCBAU 51627]MDA9435172.1 hypothetical protein [Bradyrhizobium sp. CCBAU 51627]
MRKIVFAVVVLTISWSNIWLAWGEAYFVCFLAVVVGYAVDAAYVIAYQRHAAWVKRMVSG